MIVVVDASVLVAELLRRRGRELFAPRGLQCLVAEGQWEEARHELQKRVAAIVGQGRLSSEQGKKLLDAVHDFVEGDVIEVVPRTFYEHMEHAARRRVPRDPHDWAPVALALALALDAAILTGDHDFLGCGCPTWTVETLTTELGPGCTGPVQGTAATRSRCRHRGQELVSRPQADPSTKRQGSRFSPCWSVPPRFR